MSCPATANGKLQRNAAVICRLVGGFRDVSLDFEHPHETHPSYHQDRLLYTGGIIPRQSSLEFGPAHLLHALNHIFKASLSSTRESR